MNFDYFVFHFAEFTNRMSDPLVLKEFVRSNSKKRPSVSKIRNSFEPNSSEEVNKSSSPFKMKSVPTPSQGRDSVKTDYITQVFRNADTDNSGRLTKVEFQKLLRELGLGHILESDPSFKSWDINQDDEIDYEGRL